MASTGKEILGVIYIIYAIVKITVGVSLMVLPINVISKTTVLKAFVKEAADTTFAGRFYEYILLLFGVFSLFNGLALLDLLSPAMTKYFEAQWTEYAVFIILGVALVVFYSLVLYTNIPISKNRESYDHYKLLGLFGGVTFLAMPILWEFMGYAVPAFNQLSVENRSATIVGTVIIISIVGELIYLYLKRNNKTVIQVIPQNYAENIQTAENIKQALYHKNTTPAPASMRSYTYTPAQSSAQSPAPGHT
jgi:uncharacterized membrane protein